MVKGYHEVPDEDESKISPAFQLTDKSEKIILPQNPIISPEQNLPSPIKEESIQGETNRTVSSEGYFLQALYHMNLDYKFLTIIVLLISTIGVVVLYFPRVSGVVLWLLFSVTDLAYTMQMRLMKKIFSIFSSAVLGENLRYRYILGIFLS